MFPGWPAAAWPDDDQLWDHFQKHGQRLGTRTVDAYKRSSIATITGGQRFTFTDRKTLKPRIGFYNQNNGKFTAVTEDEKEIVSHFLPKDKRYPYKLLDSTYRGRP